MRSTVTSAKKCPEKYVPYGPLSDNVSNGFLDSYGVIREAYKGVVITVHCLLISYVHTCMPTPPCAPSLAYISLPRVFFPLHALSFPSPIQHRRTLLPPSSEVWGVRRKKLSAKTKAWEWGVG